MFESRPPVPTCTALLQLNTHVYCHIFPSYTRAGWRASNDLEKGRMKGQPASAHTLSKYKSIFSGP